MTVYNINHGIGWASSGVEYAQAYRYQVLKAAQVPTKFIFTDFFAQDNISELAQQLGFLDEDIIWLYGFFTDISVAPTSFTLSNLEAMYSGRISRKETKEGQVVFYHEEEDVLVTAYLKKGSTDKVHRVEYVSQGCLIRKDYFSYTRLCTEYYTPKDNQAYLSQRRFFNQDGSVAYDEIIDGENSLFRFPNAIYYAKEELICAMLKKLELTDKDVVILDRATGTGQAVFTHVKPAKLGVVIHAEHYSANSTTDTNILWNNYYDYQFVNADKVDFFITATQGQKEVLMGHFATYTTQSPTIYVIPVGSIDALKAVNGKRHPFSIVTASRLAMEKHVDWLVKAVIQAKTLLPQLLFDIYGAGGEEGKLRAIIEEAGAGDYIRLCGHQDLSEVYGDYELYATASKSEGFGLTLLEAIGSGLAMIGFDVPYGNQTFICDNENGKLIPLPDDEEEQLIVTQFANGIISLFTRESLSQMHARSYQMANGFLTETVREQWLTMLKEIVDD